MLKLHVVQNKNQSQREEKMNTRISVGAVALCAALAGNTTHAALTVNELGSGALTAQSLVSSLLAANSGMTVSNVQFGGTNFQGGLFSGGTSAGLGFDSGVVLSSGKVSDLPLKPGDLGAETLFGTAGDPLLSSLVGTLTGDAAVLKFDFVPNASRIQMSYVFGSSEYNRFVASQFNDTFATFVNGSNVALIPGTTSIIQVHMLNCGVGDNAAPGSGPNCGQFVDNWNADGTLGKNRGINLGGFSTTFSLAADVNANVTNTMYIVIGDVRDARQDSAVFLASGSLMAVPEPGALQFLGIAAAMLVIGSRRRLHS
jgi:hypothetical protein